MLARQGYWGGEHGRILRAPADEVMEAYQHEVFVNDYESTTIEMNREAR